MSREQIFVLVVALAGVSLTVLLATHLILRILVGVHAVRANPAIAAGLKIAYPCFYIFSAAILTAIIAFPSRTENLLEGNLWRAPAAVWGMFIGGLLAQLTLETIAKRKMTRTANSRRRFDQNEEDGYE